MKGLEMGGLSVRLHNWCFLFELSQGFKREWAPFVLTPDFVYVMGGEVSRWLHVVWMRAYAHRAEAAIASFPGSGGGGRGGGGSEAKAAASFIS